MAELRSSTLTLRRGFVARRQGITGEPRQRKVTPASDVDQHRGLSTVASRRQTSGNMRRALTDAARRCRAVTARSPLLLNMTVMLSPNYFNLMLRPNILILRRTTYVNRLRDEMAATGQRRRLTNSALLHILLPLQAEQS